MNQFVHGMVLFIFFVTQNLSKKHFKDFENDPNTITFRDSASCYMRICQEYNIEFNCHNIYQKRIITANLYLKQFRHFYSTICIGTDDKDNNIVKEYTIMKGLFFETGEKFKLTPKQEYIRVTNNLDSQYYVLERVKNGSKDYLVDHFFSNSHPQLVDYFTSWKEIEMVQEEAPISKKTKEKKSIMGGFLGKKVKNESGKNTQKEIKEEVQINTVQQQVLYIQLETFTMINTPKDHIQAQEFMALIYLLSKRIHQKFQHWPRLIPVITESKRYKFLKKGSNLQEELCELFEFILKENQQRAIVLQKWNPQINCKLNQLENESDKRGTLGKLLKLQLQNLLSQQFSVKLKKGQQSIQISVYIKDPQTIFFRQTSQEINIDQYQISYYHQDPQTRQIIMQHIYDNTLILEGNRSNLLIKYLKQFVIG